MGTNVHPPLPHVFFYITQVEFHKKIPVRGGLPRSIEGDPARIGTINMFYTFNIQPSPLTFLEVSVLPIIERPRGTNFYVVDRIDRSEARLDGFCRVPSGETDIVFIDSVVKKIKLVPHWTDEKKMLAIRLWDAR